MVGKGVLMIPAATAPEDAEDAEGPEKGKEKEKKEGVYWWSYDRRQYSCSVVDTARKDVSVRWDRRFFKDDWEALGLGKRRELFRWEMKIGEKKKKEDVEKRIQKQSEEQ
jgi:hypothetical protein